jgi:hypothetical protein
VTAYVGIICDRCGIAYLGVYPASCPDCKCINPCGPGVSGC